MIVGDDAGRRTGTVAWPLALGLAVVGMLIVGFLYLVSGLAVPAWGLVILFAVWIALAWYGVRLARSRSFLVLLLPVIAVAFWVALVWFGGAVLGWQA
jgi:phosphoglycerol transferase MdoB-like AlkP superfamily enzyme